MASPILLAHDLSAACDRATQRAIWLARRDNRPLIVVWVVEDAEFADIACGTRELTDLLANQAADLATELQVRQGDPCEEIGVAAREAGAGLVVVGAHRREWPRGLFACPTAALLETGTPVLQAHDLSGGPWRGVMVGTDCSVAGRHALAAAIEIGQVSSLHLVHVYDVPFPGFITGADPAAQIAASKGRALAEAARWAAGRGQHVVAHLVRGSVVATLDQQARLLGVDLLAIGAGGDGGQPFGQTARALTLKPPCDLLVAP